jgi:hypothetical protein
MLNSFLPPVSAKGLTRRFASRPWPSVPHPTASRAAAKIVPANFAADGGSSSYIEIAGRPRRSVPHPTASRAAAKIVAARFPAGGSTPP